MARAPLGGMSGTHAPGRLPIPGLGPIEQPFWLERGQGKSRDAFC